MKTAFIQSFFLLVFISIFSSCTMVHFVDYYGFPDETNHDVITPTEVSIGDWLTYLVTTSFSDVDTAIFLGDELEQINANLPDLKNQLWSSYVFKSFLRKSNEMEMQPVYDRCNDKYYWIYVPETAWDSIKKFRLLQLPVVGITYEQAKDYVQYNQDIVNACGLSRKGGNDYRYKCFLPTPAQFDSVLTVSDSITSKNCPTFNYKNCVCFDCPYGKKLEKMPVAKMSGKAPVNVTAYNPDDFDLYNLKGNVAEMTSEKGIAKGGSCAHFATEAAAGKSQKYAQPEPWLGFRVWYRVYPK